MGATSAHRHAVLDEPIGNLSKVGGLANPVDADKDNRVGFAP